MVSFHPKQEFSPNRRRIISHPAALPDSPPLSNTASQKCRSRKQARDSYHEKREPSEVVIPYHRFRGLSESHGWFLDETEPKDLAEALTETKAGIREVSPPASEA